MAKPSTFRMNEFREAKLSYVDFVAQSTSCSDQGNPSYPILGAQKSEDFTRRALRSTCQSTLQRCRRHVNSFCTCPGSFYLAIPRHREKLNFMGVTSRSGSANTSRYAGGSGGGWLRWSITRNT